MATTGDPSSHAPVSAYFPTFTGFGGLGQGANGSRTGGISGTDAPVSKTNSNRASNNGSSHSRGGSNHVAAQHRVHSTSASTEAQSRSNSSTRSNSEPEHRLHLPGITIRHAYRDEPIVRHDVLPPHQRNGACGVSSGTMNSNRENTIYGTAQYRIRPRPAGTSARNRDNSGTRGNPKPAYTTKLPGITIRHANPENRAVTNELSPLHQPKNGGGSGRGVESIPRSFPPSYSSLYLPQPQPQGPQEPLTRSIPNRELERDNMNMQGLVVAIGNVEGRVETPAVAARTAIEERHRCNCRCCCGYIVPGVLHAVRTRGATPKTRTKTSSASFWNRTKTVSTEYFPSRDPRRAGTSGKTIYREVVKEKRAKRSLKRAATENSSIDPSSRRGRQESPPVETRRVEERHGLVEVGERGGRREETDGRRSDGPNENNRDSEEDRSNCDCTHCGSCGTRLGVA